MSINKKLYYSFGLILILLSMLGAFSAYQIDSITKAYDEVIAKHQKVGQDAKDVHILILSTRRHEKNYISRRDPKYLASINKTLADMDKLLTNISSLCGQLALTKSADEAAKAKTAATAYKKRILQGGGAGSGSGRQKNRHPRSNA